MQATTFPRLFSPLELRGRRLRNRIVSTAHTTCFAEDGLPGRRHLDYYCERADGGVGLIVMEPTPVHETARIVDANFLHDDDRIVPALAALADAVRERGAVLVSQLYHVGPHADPLASLRERWGPSAVQIPGFHDRVHAMAKREIAEVVDAFARGAERIARADMDGAEVLMAYDTLPDVFMSPLYNHRTDEYGGSLENRLRLAREILRRCREALGDGRLLGVTLSGDHLFPGGLAIDDCVEIAVSLTRDCELDYVAIGNGSYPSIHFLIPNADVPPAFGARLAQVVKEAVPDTVVIGEGRVSTPALAEELLEQGVCDLVGMNRALIADPELPRKAEEGKAGEIRPCIYCNQSCLGRRHRQFAIGCVQNPAVGFEGTLGRRGLTRAAAEKRVVVVGGGPSGLEAARVAAERGHDVTLFEAGDQLGGQARLAARLPHHGEFIGVVDYRERELARLGVRVVTGRRVGPGEVAALVPDVVVVATGSTPDCSGYQPALGGPVALADGAAKRVIPAADVVAGTAVPDGDVVILDGEGHRKSLGTAELLAAGGRAVTVVSADAVVGGELEWIAARAGYLERLAALGVRLLASSVVVAYDGERVRVRTLYDGREEELPAGALVLSTPHVAEDSLVGPLEAEGIEPITIGDARAPRLLDAAINDGFRVAFAL